MVEDEVEIQAFRMEEKSVEIRNHGSENDIDRAGDFDFAEKGLEGDIVFQGIVFMGGISVYPLEVVFSVRIEGLLGGGLVV